MADPDSSGTPDQLDNVRSVQPTLSDVDHMKILPANRRIPIVNAFPITANYDRDVTVTCGLPTNMPLPNRLFTLQLSTITAILHHWKVVEDHSTFHHLFALCHKTYMAEHALEANGTRYTCRPTEYCDPTTAILHAGRVFSDAVDEEPFVEGEGDGRLRLVRLPPVLQLWHGRATWFVRTRFGVYSWSIVFADWGQTGSESTATARRPQRVHIDEEVKSIVCGDDSVFFQTLSGWLACGRNDAYQLGLGRCGYTGTPVFIPGSEGVTRCEGSTYCTFAWGRAGLLACGVNNEGQCGTGNNEVVTTLTPVAIPEDVKGRVDRVVESAGCSTFILSGTRCFACGLNRSGQLGIEPDLQFVTTPVELPFIVYDVVSPELATVFRTDSGLMVCGDNACCSLSPTQEEILVPIRLDYPGPVYRVVIHPFNIFVETVNGVWYGRGDRDASWCPRSFLNDFFCRNRDVKRWTRVKAAYGTPTSVGMTNGVMVVPR